MTAPDQVEVLNEVLENLRESLQMAPHEKRAPLAAQIRATLSELAALASAEKKAGDPLDDLAARRAARGGATARPRRAAGHTG